MSTPPGYHLSQDLTSTKTIYTKIQLHGDRISIVRVTNHSVSATLGENLSYETDKDINAYRLTGVDCECYTPVNVNPCPQPPTLGLYMQGYQGIRYIHCAPVCRALALFGMFAPNGESP